MDQELREAAIEAALESQNARDAIMEEPIGKTYQEYRPSKKDALREYEINIRFLDRGCVIKVGCKEIAFEDISKAMDVLNAYVTGDTYELQEKWRKLLS